MTSVFTDGTDTKDVYSVKTTQQWYQKNIWAQLFGRTYQQDLSDAYATIIQNPNFGNLTVTSRAKGSDVKARQYIDTAQLKMVRDQRWEFNVGINQDDLLTAPKVPWQELIRRAIMQKVDEYANANLQAYLLSLTYDNTAGNGRSFKVARENPGDNYISTAVPGTWKGTGIQLINDAIEELLTVCYEANYIDGVDITGTPQAGLITLVLSPRQFKVLLANMRAQKLDWDKINQELYMKKQSLFDNKAFAGMLMGVNIVVTNTYPAPAGADTEYDCYALLPGGLEFANYTEATKTFTPSDTTDDWDYAMAQKGSFGRLAVNPERVFKIELDSKANA